jgi:hypothetical protein
VGFFCGGGRRSAPAAGAPSTAKPAPATGKK